ncbi:hypothetical protein FBUS_10129 [Fasciolopsis buskii]|uniref:Uncharacterized protein n=1 Tax=Fasciolopsis buskii TaxID=27845 RepID=A0A8E0RU05_9TREM|nr:hypothetical protein FBUS_10129 [Fasciolopsis buski]
MCVDIAIILVRCVCSIACVHGTSLRLGQYLRLIVEFGFSFSLQVYTFTESSDVCQIKWSPLRQAWLGVLTTDSSAVKLYDTFPMYLQTLDESEQFSFERFVFPSGRPYCPLLAFSWHPSLPNCLLTLDRDGCIDIAELIERPAVAWSPEQALLWSHSGQWTACDPWSLKSSRSVQYFGLTQPINSTTAVGEHHHGPSEQPVADDLADPTQAASIRRRSSVVVDLQQHLANDIGTVMRRRAELGYGMGLDPEVYINVLGETTSLGTMWRWIKCILLPRMYQSIAKLF